MNKALAVIGIAGLAVVVGWSAWPNRAAPIPDGPLVRECNAALVSLAIDRQIQNITEGFADPIARASACRQFAKLGSDPDFDSVAGLPLEREHDCQFFQIVEYRKQIAAALTLHSDAARKACGPALDIQSAKAAEQAEFTNILENDTVESGRGRLAGRLERFATHPDLPTCLTAAWAENDMPILRMRMVELVARCELSLGIPPVKPSERWPIPY